MFVRGAAGELDNAHVLCNRWMIIRFQFHLLTFRWLLSVVLLRTLVSLRRLVLGSHLDVWMVGTGSGLCSYSRYAEGR